MYGGVGFGVGVLEHIHVAEVCIFILPVQVYGCTSVDYDMLLDREAKHSVVRIETLLQYFGRRLASMTSCFYGIPSGGLHMSLRCRGPI